MSEPATETNPSPISEKWPVELPSRAEEAAAFHSMRRNMLRSSLAQLASEHRLRMTMAVLLSIAFWFGVYFLVREGFEFLRDNIGAEATFMATVARVFNLFYASLMVMLVFSTAIILYGSLYRTPEVCFLLTTPASEGRIFTYKFQEAIFFSSWGFFLLGSPMLVAFGAVKEAPWHYYALMLPYMIAFVFVPAGLGAIACLLIVHYFTRFRNYISAVLIAVVAALAVSTLWWLMTAQESELLSPDWLRNVSGRLQFVEYRFFPSWWLSSGMLEASHAQTEELDYSPLSQALLFLMPLVSNALVLYLLAHTLARKIFRKSFSRLQTAVTPRRRHRVHWLDRLIPKLLPFFPHQIKLLIVKDLRIFRRDPLQWSQLLIFFGLLALYFLNVRSTRIDTAETNWVNVVSFLYLAVVGLILSTFTTRFIFPMISLEGRRFWVLGLLPLKRGTILWGKFVFAAVGSAIPCTLLILLSDMMLKISPLVTAVHQLTCLLLCVGLSGIAVGLGAKMPDLRETSPSKIAAGFGGTLNLVVSAVYIVLVVGLTAVPCHFYVIAQSTGADGIWDLDRLRYLMIGGIGGAIVIGVIATWLPMWLGFKAFNRLEF